MYSESEIQKVIETYGDVTCIHRHRWPDHKSCFARGLIKIKNGGGRLDAKQFEKKTGIPWYKVPGTRVGYFDIETDNLNADFGTVLSWVIKSNGEKRYDCAVVTKEELFNGTQDRRLVEEFVAALSNYDIICGYYSTGFDFPYMRAKALHYNIPFPGYGDLYHWDVYYTVKSKLKISRKSLDNACDYLGIVGKTPISKDAWRKAKYGDPASLKYVLDHNLGDVDILEELHDRLEFTRQWNKRSV